jgi:hypothetical protein
MELVGISDKILVAWQTTGSVSDRIWSKNPASLQSLPYFGGLLDCKSLVSRCTSSLVMLPFIAVFSN